MTSHLFSNIYGQQNVLPPLDDHLKKKHMELGAAADGRKLEKVSGQFFNKTGWVIYVCAVCVNRGGRVQS